VVGRERLFVSDKLRRESEGSEWRRGGQLTTGTNLSNKRPLCLPGFAALPFGGDGTGLPSPTASAGSREPLLTLPTTTTPATTTTAAMTLPGASGGQTWGDAAGLSLSSSSSTVSSSASSSSSSSSLLSPPPWPPARPPCQPPSWKPCS